MRQRHQNRIEHNPDFRFLREQKALITELRQQTQVSLNEKVREQERKANDDKRLKLENERRKAKGMTLLTSIDDEETDNAAKTEKKDDKKPEEDDALLIEAGHILVDYMNIQTASMTAQREAK